MTSQAADVKANASAVVVARVTVPAPAAASFGPKIGPGSPACGPQNLYDFRLIEKSALFDGTHFLSKCVDIAPDCVNDINDVLDFDDPAARCANLD
jgi:hypothetical protein